jgi:hypothetical protein
MDAERMGEDYNGVRKFVLGAGGTRASCGDVLVALANAFALVGTPTPPYFW